MNRLVRRLRYGFSLCSLASVAQAHPGHDGHELTWDLDHLIAHPGATVLCFATLGASAYVAYRFGRWVRDEPQRDQ